MGTSFANLEQLPRPFGAFTLVRVIAQGGMGQVFLALRSPRDEPIDEVCVVKTVRTDLKDDREAIGRFLDEARVVQKLDHAAICHTLDAGIVDKTYYLAMEFISGRNLRDVQTRAQKVGRPLPEALIFHALTEMLDALDYAHDVYDPDTDEHLRIVHRDVSPHNVMLGFDGHVKLIDFGLATHELKREMTRPGIMVGKLRYNAPEQVRDRAIDGRSDIYSVGIILYELITGERFYEGLTEEDIWRQAMKGTHRPSLFSSVPQDIQAILNRSLTLEPDDRFPNAGDMKEALSTAARARNLREMRRQSARFMGEIFVDEQQSERDMILQATGLAEARTRLFAMPLREPLHDESSAGGEPSLSSLSSVDRTNLASPSPGRGRLTDLAPDFDPNAETAFGDRPFIEPAAHDADDDDGDHSDPFATSKPHVEQMEQVEEADEPTEKPTKRSLPQEDKTPSGETIAADGTLVTHIQNLRDELDADDAHDQATVAARGRPLRPGHSVGSFTPLTRGDAVTSPMALLLGAPNRIVTNFSQRPWSAAALVAAGACMAALLLSALAFALWPRPPAKDEAPDRDARVVALDQPSLTERATPEALVPSAPLPDGSLPDAPDPPVVDSGAGAGPPPAAVEQVRPKKPKTPKPERPAPAKPPQMELKTLREQVEYLRAHCLERVTCARPTTAAAARLAKLSAQETKALIQEIPKCIARCQR